MKLLALETSTETMSIALGYANAAGQGMEVVASYSGAGGAQSSATTLPQVLKLLAEAGWSLRDLDAIAFGEGPGSFTGLRTACSVAQGLAFGADLPVLPIDTLMTVAEEAYGRIVEGSPHHAQAGLRVIAAMDARMSEVYAATYERLPATDTPLPWRSEAASLDAPENLPMPSPSSPESAVWLAGSARAAYADRLPASALALPYIDCLPTASALLRLAPGLLDAGLAVDPALAIPRYVRDKVAKTTVERMEEHKAKLDAAAQADAQTTSR